MQETSTAGSLRQHAAVQEGSPISRCLRLERTRAAHKGLYEHSHLTLAKKPQDEELNSCTAEERRGQQSKADQRRAEENAEEHRT
ncbi:unnamed protein product [Sphagnum jensenii]